MLNARKTLIAAALLAVAPTLAFAATTDAKPAQMAPAKAEHVVKPAKTHKAKLVNYTTKHHAKSGATKINGKMAKKPAVATKKS